MVEHHLNVVVLFLVSKEVVDEAAKMVAHCTSEVKSIQGRLIDVRVVDELVFKFAMASKPWWQDVGVFKCVPA